MEKIWWRIPKRFLQWSNYRDAIQGRRSSRRRKVGIRSSRNQMVSSIDALKLVTVQGARTLLTESACGRPDLDTFYDSQPTCWERDALCSRRLLGVKPCETQWGTYSSASTIFPDRHRVGLGAQWWPPGYAQVPIGRQRRGCRTVLQLNAGIMQFLPGRVERSGWSCLPLYYVAYPSRCRSAMVRIGETAYSGVASHRVRQSIARAGEFLY
jgi:hypothetical protein